MWAEANFFFFSSFSLSCTAIIQFLEVLKFVIKNKASKQRQFIIGSCKNNKKRKKVKTRSVCEGERQQKGSGRPVAGTKVEKYQHEP
jgi:hypothetical protein